jgi:ABC-type glycerol-3-phosphate transport system substrate-binding protein
VAAREIAEFNKQYPDIKVIYKKVPSDNYAAVLKPALANGAQQRMPSRHRHSAVS